MDSALGGSVVSILLGLVCAAAGTLSVYGSLVGLVDRSALIAALMALVASTWALLGPLLGIFALLDDSWPFMSRLMYFIWLMGAFSVGPLACLVELKYGQRRALWFLRPGLILRRGIERHIAATLERLSTSQEPRPNGPAAGPQSALRRAYLKYRYFTGDDIKP